MPNLAIGRAAPLSELENQARRDPSHPSNAGHKTMSFGDLVDMVNPLQHIPLVSAVYRHLTGDEISGHSRIIGGALYGGPIGMAYSMIDATVEETSGRDVSGHVMAQIFGGEGDEALPQQPPRAQFAEAETAPEPSTSTPATAPVPARGAESDPKALANAMTVGLNLQRFASQTAEATTPHAPEDTAAEERTLTGDAALAALAADLGGGNGGGGNFRDSRAPETASRAEPGRNPQTTEREPRSSPERSSPRETQLASAERRGPGENSRFMPIERQHYNTSPALRARAAAQRAQVELAQQDIRTDSGARAAHPTLSAALVQAQAEAQQAYNSAEETARKRSEHTQRSGAAAAPRSPATSSVQPSPAPQPQSASRTMPAEDFSSRMLEALDKYRGMQ